MTACLASPSPATAPSFLTPPGVPVSLTIPFEFLHSFVPPRCRNPRTERRTGDCTVTIPHVTDADAPLGLRVTLAVNAEDDDTALRFAWGERDALAGDYRLWNGRLWRQEDKTPDALFGDVRAIGRRHQGYSSDRREVIERKLIDWAAAYLFVDGALFSAAREPAFHVTVDHRFRSEDAIDVALQAVDEDFVSPDWYRADQEADAYEYASALAALEAETGGTASQIRRSRYTVEVLRPDAVRRTFTPSADLTATHEVEIEAQVTTSLPMPLPRSCGREGYRLTDGRFLIPVLAFEVIDEEASTRALVSAEDVQRVGLTIESPRTRMTDRDRTHGYR